MSCECEHYTALDWKILRVALASLAYDLREGDEDTTNMMQAEGVEVDDNVIARVRELVHMIERPI